MPARRAKIDCRLDQDEWMLWKRLLERYNNSPSEAFRALLRHADRVEGLDDDYVKLLAIYLRIKDLNRMLSIIKKVTWFIDQKVEDMLRDEDVLPPKVREILYEMREHIKMFRRLLGEGEPNAKAEETH